MSNEATLTGSDDGRSEQAELPPQTAAMLNLLGEAARDEDLWAVLLEDPKHYLSERGVELPNGYQLIIHQTPINRNNPPVVIDCPPGLVGRSRTILKKVCVKSIEGMVTKEVTNQRTGEVIVISEQQVYACLEWKWEFVTEHWCALAVTFP